ncbi:MAG: hypothetical protein ACE5DN_00160 [Flavobacteriales bacterium]
MPHAKISAKQRFERIFYFFPFQLLLVHLKKNHAFLIFWFLMFAMVTGHFAAKFGVPYLFLYPEYLGHVNFTSHFLIGFACGGFIMAFNITSYVVNAFRFPFIATLSRPFLKYCINNAFIPLAFVITYLICLVDFQLNKELEPAGRVVFNVIGFLSGNAMFLLISFIYFFSTNKNLVKLFGMSVHDAPVSEKKKRKKLRKSPVQGIIYRRERWYNIFSRDRKWHIETYLSGLFRISLARPADHYGRSMLYSVFTQNHLNATVFEAMVLITVLVLGLFRENAYFVIPAGSSVFLLFAIFLMVFSAIHSWLRGWATSVFIALLLLLNFLSKYEAFTYTTYAYGLDYDVPKTEYSKSALDSIRNINFSDDYSLHISILDKWLQREKARKLGSKPKMVLINCSGGGLRSAMWTYHILQHADSVNGGDVMHNARLITGSSGGMLGSAYFREIFLRKQQDKEFRNEQFVQDMGKDILNPVAFTIAVNDLFLRLQKFAYQGHRYTKDRGFAFEQQVNRNTRHMLDKTLSDYRRFEEDASIPIMVFAPAMVNDGRRVLISSLPSAFLTRSAPFGNVINDDVPESIEFLRFFDKQHAGHLRFLSAIRMNATFPYIMPVTSLPSEPSIDVMDAGIRDNFGLTISLKYLYTFKNWIARNTDGVVIIQTRDKPHNFEIDDGPGRNFFQNMISPLGSFYSNWPNIQNFSQDELLQYAGHWFNGRLEVIRFELPHKENQNISLSWHLTKKEKEAILSAIHLPENSSALFRLNSLLSGDKPDAALADHKTLY